MWSHSFCSGKVRCICKVRQKDAVKKVIASMTVGKDVSALFADVVTFSNNLNQKQWA